MYPGFFSCSQKGLPMASPPAPLPFWYLSRKSPRSPSWTTASLLGVPMAFGLDLLLAFKFSKDRVVERQGEVSLFFLFQHYPVTFGGVLGHVKDLWLLFPLLEAPHNTPFCVRGGRGLSAPLWGLSWGPYYYYFYSFLAFEHIMTRRENYPQS